MAQGEKIGKKIEEKFELEKMQKGEIKTISMEELKNKADYDHGKNGHSALRDGSNGGKTTSYLIEKYNVEKVRIGNQKSGKIIALKIQKR